MTGVLIKKGKFEDRHTQTHFTPFEDEGRDSDVISSSTGMPEIASKPPDAR